MCHNAANPKSVFILWIALWGRLIIQDLLMRWGIPVDGMCVLFRTCMERQNHLFFDCCFPTTCKMPCSVYNGIKLLWTGKWNDNGYTGIQGARKTQNVLLKAFLCTLFMTFGLKGMLDSIRKEPTEWRTCCMILKLLSVLESDKIGDFLSSKYVVTFA